MSDARVTRTEQEGVAARPVVYVAVGFLIFVGICLAGIFFFYSDVIGERKQLKAQAFPPPQLQRTPLLDIETLQRRQRQQLTGYASVDRAHGIVRLPVERAMEILASKGPAAFGALDDLNRTQAQNIRKSKTAKAAQYAPAPPGLQP